MRVVSLCLVLLLANAAWAAEEGVASSRVAGDARDACRLFSSALMESFYRLDRTSVEAAARAGWGDSAQVRVDGDQYVVTHDGREVAVVSIKGGSLDSWSCE